MTCSLPRTRAGVQLACAPSEIDAQADEPLAAWLGGRELAELAKFRDPRRRAQWLTGRRLIKRLLRRAMAPDTAPADLQILSRNERGLGARPRVLHRGRPLDCELSISHDAGNVVVVLARRGEHRLGVDLIAPAPFDERFIQLWFSAAERSWIADAAARRAPRLWAIKEAVYKAANAGEGWDPRRIEIVCRGDHFDCHFFDRMLSATVEICQLGGRAAVVVSIPRDAGAPQRSDVKIGEPAEFSGAFRGQNRI